MYGYPVKSLIETGHLSVKGLFAPTLLLQVAWGYIFCLIGGFSFTALRFSTLVLAFIGLLFFYKIIKRNSHSSLLAFLLTILVMCNPFLISLSYSFMTDVPFLSLCLISIYFFQLFFITKKTYFLFYGTIFSIAGFLIRQPAILFIPIMVMLILLYKETRKKYWIHSVSMLIIMVFVYIITEWFKVIFDIKDVYVNVSGLYLEQLATSPFFILSQITKKCVKTIITIGLYTLPVIPLIRNIFNLKVRWHIIIIISNLLLLLILIHMGRIFPFEGNIVINFGIGPVLLKDINMLGLQHMPYLPQLALITINFIGQIAGTYFCIALIRYLLVNFKPFHIFLITSVFIYIVLMAITSFFDRYLLYPIVISLTLISPIIETNLLKGVRRIITLLLFLPIAWLAIFGTADYMSWKRSQQKAFNWITSQNVSIKEINAGLELNGWYNCKKVLTKIPENYWFVDDDKYVLSMGKIDGYATIKSFPFRRYLNLSSGYIYVLKRDNH